MSVRSRELARAFSSALWIALIPGGLLFAAMQIRGYAHLGMITVDAHAYWMAARDPSSWYTRPPATWDAYLYSPAFAQAFWPLGQLPWHVFQVVWTALLVGLTAWLLAPLGWRKGMTAALFVVPELVLGNVYLLYATVLVLMVRGAAGAVAFPILTKVFPGVVGLWFVVRGQWRQVAWAAAWTAGVIAVSAAFAPHAWVAWLHFLTVTAGTGRGVGATLRLALAVILVVVAARSDRTVVLAPALVLACPLLGAYSALAPLAALPRLARRDREHRAAAQAAEHQVVVGRERQPELVPQT